MAKAVGRWPLATEASVRSPLFHVESVVDKATVVHAFLRVLRYSLSV
jgi:hypothetical protein